MTQTNETIVGIFTKGPGQKTQDREASLWTVIMAVWDNVVGYALSPGRRIKGWSML
jgi:hypothetical protein